MKNVLSLFVAFLLLTGCSTVPLTGRRQVMLVSEQEVLTSSLSQYGEYMKTAKKSTSKTQTDQVVRVGKKIAAATEAYLKENGLAEEVKNFSWEFNLVQDQEMNAFCMPGGKIVVNEGLMKIVTSDDELAVVMGHEVAHAVAKHSNERMSQQLLTQYGGALVGLAVSQKNEAVQGVANSVYALGSQVGVILPFSRKHESEADYMGLILMTMAGYNPQVAVHFWEKMSAGGGGSVPEFLSTHPSGGQRISDIQRYLPEMEKYKRK
ncbi:M48 family peptidase [Parabacteroides sp. 52]|uniref:M48 family metallopeptidase n=1 Tax=unclassified Parabacteroides TaxID=2649774 RepID=UPI0013D50569|nr:MULTISPECIES: M48 family metallopeptidase [unclassified Parabacteroides]MDH6534501.1 putative Zn-dependent protease [Parabacteroides sp. PM5-20]NDV55049.1 M48 family peptidase [Parabacteroides sp. 52]